METGYEDDNRGRDESMEGQYHRLLLSKFETCSCIILSLKSSLQFTPLSCNITWRAPLEGYWLTAMRAKEVCDPPSFSYSSSRD